jgi:serine phosphatase RsbU (regulator of sigma subunit)
MARAAHRPLGSGPAADPDHGLADVSSLLSRRPIALVALAAVLLFAAVAGALGWRQYRDAQHAALNEERTRAVLAAEIFDVYFGGQLGTLSSIAQAPVVRRGDEAGMLAYFKRIQPRNGKLFPGGLSWVDRNGVVRVSTLRPAPGHIADVSDRSYFRAAIRTGKPFVSEGLTARLSHKQVFVSSVPTRDASGAINGVLTGTLRVKPNRGDKATLDLGFGGLAIVDRRKQAIVVGLVRPARLLNPERFAARQGVLSDTDGLDGASGHVLAFAHSAIPQWTVILDRPRSAVFAAARRTLFLESALLGGVALLDLALLAWIFARARAEARTARERAVRRTLRYQQEHEVAVTLQRSLLADVPPIEAVDSAARYQAGSTGLEVGGDWFDVLRRHDGVIQVTVGDVAGQGVSAAALMGQLRNAFRAYAFEHTSPQEILSRMFRHMGRDDMATAVCIAIDPAAGEISYASAGHPPALLRDDESGSIVQLDAAQAPPLGATDPARVREARLPLPRRATLIAYTDGMIERRDEAIDDGIERLAAALAATPPGETAADLADRLIREVAEVTAADDDVALLVLRFSGASARSGHVSRA